MPTLQLYFWITVMLSILGWTGLARVVRGKLLQLREEDYALAARGAGASDWRIITRHLLPGFTSHLIVSITFSVPGMILAETALSFIGVGIQPPAVSWGTLLQDAQNLTAVAQQHWLLIPAVWVIATVLLFNFVGDGLRDAADPYSR
jgi:peptide/nickel transport system permease protein